VLGVAAALFYQQKGSIGSVDDDDSDEDPVEVIVD